jgi:hypothetical protein
VLIDNKPGGGNASLEVQWWPKRLLTATPWSIVANSLVINAKLNTNLPYDGSRLSIPLCF